jgi:hypothetical protein
MRPHISGTECVGFIKARRLWEPSSSSATGKFSPFRTLRKASAVNVRWTDHTFLSHKNILKLTLSCVSQATQYSPSMESPEDLRLVNKG